MSTLPPAIPRLLRRHPALFVTVVYLAVSLTGMAFSWAFFRSFGVNYFMFADLTDFLLAAAREPVSLLAAAGGIVFIWLLYLYGHWRADTLLDGEGTIVEARIGDDEPRVLLLMGSSARFVFLYDHAQGRTVIVPDESLVSLTVTHDTEPESQEEAQ